MEHVVRCPVIIRGAPKQMLCPGTCETAHPSCALLLRPQDRVVATFLDDIGRAIAQGERAR